MRPIGVASGRVPTVAPHGLIAPQERLGRGSHGDGPRGEAQKHHPQGVSAVGAYKSAATAGTLVTFARPQTYAWLSHSTSTRIPDVAVVAGVLQARRDGEQERQRGGRIRSPRKRHKLKLLLQSRRYALRLDLLLLKFLEFGCCFVFWVRDLQFFRVGLRVF